MRTHMRRGVGRTARAMLLGSAAMLAWTGVATAQVNDASGTMVEGVEVTGRQSVVATQGSAATKTATPIDETPQSISVIDQTQLVLRNPQDLNQAISYSAGVTPSEFGYDPRFSQFEIRGFSELYNGVYQDGLRLFGSDFIAPLLEPYGLQQLEIVRGPTSVLYGQNAPGGLIDLVSKRPQPDRFGELQLQVGSFDRYDGRFDLNSPLTQDGSLLGRFVGVERQSGTQYADVPDDETYLAPSLTWKPNEGTSLTLLTSYQRVSGGESDQFYEAKLLPPGYPQTVYGGEKDFNESIQRTWNIGYAFKQALGGSWNLNQSFRYSDSHMDYRFPQVLGFDSPTTIARYAEALTETLRAVTVDTNVSGAVTTGPAVHTLVVGVDYQHTPFTERELTGPAPDLNYIDPVYGLPIPQPTNLASSIRQTTDQVGVYAQDQIKFGQHWALTGGVRQDWDWASTSDPLGSGYLGSGIPGQENEAAVTGRVGLVYLSDFGVAPYVSYSTSFLPQLGTDFSGKPFDPLTGEQYEIGVRYQPKGGWVSATVSLYNLTEDNVLSADPDISHTGFQVETGQERSRGVEFEVVAHPAPGLNLTGAYTYDDVRITRSTTADELNSHPMDTPAIQASIFADYTLQHGLLAGLGFGGGVRYAGSSFDGSDNADAYVNPSQTYVDAQVHYDFGHWRAAINATNLADKEYPICFGGVCNFSRRRDVIGSLAYKF
jgi:iron complex outermembrane receptor protein